MINICRNPTSGKVMNAPREYYPVGYEKNFDDHFQSKVDLPDTNFHCGDQKYFPGLYGDEQLGCMVSRNYKNLRFIEIFCFKNASVSKFTVALIGISVHNYGQVLTVNSF